MDFNLLYRWFVGLGIDDRVWDASTFCKNRDRLLEAELTLAGDKGYDVEAFVEDLRGRKVTPHIAVQDHVSKTGKRRKTKIDARTTGHPGYAIS